MDLTNQQNQQNQQRKQKQISTKLITIVGLSSAIAFILTFVKFPISYLGFLELEFSDVPAIICGLIYGPLAGVMVELVKNLLHLTATSTGGIGELSNFVVSAGYILPLCYFFKKSKQRKNIIISFILGIAGITVAGILVNYFITVPMYLELFGKDAVMAMVQVTIPSIKSVGSLIIIGITPFNIFKGIVISITGYYMYKLLYKRL